MAIKMEKETVGGDNHKSCNVLPEYRKHQRVIAAEFTLPCICYWNDCDNKCGPIKFVLIHDKIIKTFGIFGTAYLTWHYVMSHYRKTEFEPISHSYIFKRSAFDPASHFLQLLSLAGLPGVGTYLSWHWATDGVQHTCN